MMRPLYTSVSQALSALEGIPYPLRYRALPSSVLQKDILAEINDCGPRLRRST